MDGITDSMDMSLSKPLELVMDTEAQRPAGHGVPKSQTRISNIAVNRHGPFYLHRQPFKIQCLSHSMVLFNALKNKLNSKFCSLKINLTSY